jgi:uncharacterized HhH-GPD family protein
VFALCARCKSPTTVVDMALRLAQNPDADALITEDAFALFVGMILDQQIPLERAFAAPFELRTRLGGTLDAQQVVEMDPDTLVEAFVRKPALHRFPAANAERVQKFAHIVVDEYNGDAASIWTGAATGAELLKRVEALPGFGKQKAKIFVALLGKQLSVKPKGWREACTPFGDTGTMMSIADIKNDKTLAAVRAWKQAKKAAAKSGS